MAKKKASSRAWMAEHVTDQYVRQAQKDGFRSRASYKLLEIDEKYHCFKPGQWVVDLGSAPGGWSQIIVEKIMPKGRLIAMDLLPMEAIAGVDFLQADFTDDATLLQLESMLAGHRVDAVISDMAPNISGILAVDQAKSIGLCEMALDFAANWLRPDGLFIIKVFQGTGYQRFHDQCRQRFSQLLTFKPKASRDRSTEIYLIGRGIK